jgi:GxxExxY protein
MEELTERVLGAVFEVANELGCGFLEKVYERALVRELGARGIRAAAQAPMVVAYKGQAVGEYFADVLVEDVLVMELKCVERLGNEHMAQCLNYLKASGLEVCLLVNFQRSKVEWRRIVQTGMATDEQERQEEWPRMNTDKHG